jgi:hypothetical protein
MPFMTGAEYARSRRSDHADEAKRTRVRLRDAVLVPGPQGGDPEADSASDRGGGHSVFGRPNNLNGW